MIGLLLGILGLQLFAAIVGTLVSIETGEGSHPLIGVLLIVIEAIAFYVGVQVTHL